MDLPRDGVGNHAVDADRHEQQPDSGEDAEQDQAEARFRVRKLLEKVVQGADVRQRDAAIDGPDLLAHAVQHRRRLARRAHQDAALELTGNRVRHQQLRPYRIPDAVVLGVGDHADDVEDRMLDRRVRPTAAELERDLPADRILAAEVLRDERLVDDGDAAGARDVDRGQHAPAYHSQTERVGPALADQLVQARPLLGVCLARDVEIRADAAVGRQRDRLRRRDDAGQRVQARQQRLEEPLLFGGSLVGAARKRQPGDQNVVGVEPEVDALKSIEASHQQSRADQQHQRQRDLDHDERVPQPAAAEARPYTFAGALQRLDDVAPGGLRGGGQAEEQHGDDGRAQAEEQHRQIQADVRLAGNHPVRDHRDQGLEAGPGEEAAERRAADREVDALDQQLPDQTAAAGAE